MDGYIPKNIPSIHHDRHAATVKWHRLRYCRDADTALESSTTLSQFSLMYHAHTANGPSPVLLIFPLLCPECPVCAVLCNGANVLCMVHAHLSRTSQCTDLSHGTEAIRDFVTDSIPVLFSLPINTVPQQSHQRSLYIPYFHLHWALCEATIWAIHERP